MMWEVEWHDTINKIVKKHGMFSTKEEAFASIQEWWKRNNFKPRYSLMGKERHNYRLRISLLFLSHCKKG